LKLLYIMILFIFNISPNFPAENVCRAPHPEPVCAPDAPIKSIFYFDDRTDQCEKYTGCGGGLNDFESIRSCKDACPYGKFCAYS
ncbi:secreted protein, putative, partial [Ixodes scapularis]